MNKYIKVSVLIISFFIVINTAYSQDIEVVVHRTYIDSTLGSEMVFDMEVINISQFQQSTVVSSKGDDAHTYPVEISVPNKTDKPLKAGMFARIYFSSLLKSPVISIPREAIVGSTRSPQVFVVEKGIAKLRDISVGEQFGTFIEVLNGLNEGEHVVTSGQNIIQNNFKVEIVK